MGYLDAINPMQGKGFAERLLPLVLVLGWLVATLGVVFGYVEFTDATTPAYGALSLYAGTVLQKNA